MTTQNPTSRSAVAHLPASSSPQNFKTSVHDDSDYDGRGSEQAAYEYLTNVINDGWRGPLSIEVLPPALQQDQYAIRILDNAIGVPDTLLVLAFQYARLLCFSGLPQARQQGLDLWDDVQHTMNCTQIMLLFDPTHATAANERKRKLKLLLDVASVPSPAVIDEVIRKELWLLDSLQTSPLAKHTKSAVLWYHRKWLMDEFLEWVLDVQRATVLGSKRMSILLAPGDMFGSNPTDPTDILWRSFVEPELRTIFSAGEQHPLNYHAWDFARRLVDTITDYADLNELDLPRLLNATTDLVQDWCLLHLSDTSGWAFLLHMMERIDDASAVTRVFVNVGNQAVSYRYRQEPVWIFIRTLLASETMLDGPFRATFVGELQGWLESELELKKKIDGERAQAAAQRGDGDVQTLANAEPPYFDLVVAHLRWVKDRYEGEPRPAIFAPMPLTPS